MPGQRRRFDVFKRDGFQCAYCGRRPPDVVLEADHVVALADGGADDINNLITACFDCNRGKSDKSLSEVPKRVSQNLEAIQDKELQIIEYNNFLVQIHKRIRKDINAVAKVFGDSYSTRDLTEEFKQTSLRRFLEKLPTPVVKEAMEIACAKFPWSPSKATRYFCGICWNTIRRNEQG